MVRFVFALLCLFATPAIAQESCRTIPNDADRLACYDLEFGLNVTQQERSEGFGKWTVSTDVSLLTDDKTVVLNLESETEVRGRFGTPRPATLILRCHENKTVANFIFNELFMSDHNGRGRLEYRLDQDTMKTVQTQVSNDNMALGLWSGASSIPWIKAM